MRPRRAAAKFTIAVTLWFVSAASTLAADPPSPAVDDGFVKIGDIRWYNSLPHALALAERNRQWVVLLRMLGDLGGKA